MEVFFYFKFEIWSFASIYWVFKSFTIFVDLKLQQSTTLQIRKLRIRGLSLGFQRHTIS